MGTGVRKDRLYDRLSGYELIIFDMDGTLYYQRGMQIRMAFRLLRHAMLCGGYRDLAVIQSYRRLREQWDSSVTLDEERLYDKLASKTGYDAKKVRDIIRTWMFEKPMDVVRECRDERLICTIEKLAKDGRQVMIYSDYPTEDKCRAVGLSDDIRQYYCGQGEIRTMKPNPSGLFYIMSCYPDIPKDKVIMVGDRADRDKAAADKAGIKSIILGRFRLFRYIF